MLFRVHSLEEAIQVANDTPFGLGASAWTLDPAEQQQLVANIQAGQVFLNAMVSSDPRLPFGGIKRSGFGRELSAAGMREFLNAKTVVHRRPRPPNRNRLRSRSRPDRHPRRPGRRRIRSQPQPRPLRLPPVLPGLPHRPRRNRVAPAAPACCCHPRGGSAVAVAFAVASEIGPGFSPDIPAPATNRGFGSRNMVFDRHHKPLCLHPSPKN